MLGAVYKFEASTGTEMQIGGKSVANRWAFAPGDVAKVSRTGLFELIWNVGRTEELRNNPFQRPKEGRDYVLKRSRPFGDGDPFSNTGYGRRDKRS